MKCLCGCNQEVKLGNKYINDHQNRGRVTWNKGLTKETDERVKKQAEEHTGYKHTEEDKRKIGKASEGNKNCLGLKQSEETKRKRIKSRKWYKPSKETKRKISEAQSNSKSRTWKGGCEGYWHKKAWELFGHDCCENCYITNEEHKIKWKQRLDMHNTLDPKDYKIMESEAWMTLCRICHRGLEAALENDRLLYKVK
jgi:hypothetical protein